jgi:hypothetical protein
VSNRFYTQYATGPEKNRWSSVAAILGGAQKFLVDEMAVTFIDQKLMKPVVTNYFSRLKSVQIYSREDLEKLLEEDPMKDLEKRQKDIMRTGAAIEAVRSRQLRPHINFIVSDDAPNFVDLVRHHQLCWVHEIRKYKLCEVFKRVESETMEKLVEQRRSFYALRLRFKAERSRELRMKIREEFRRICSIKTLVKPLEDQLLHNNQAELDVRDRVIKGKISLQNRSNAGVRAWDLMLSLASTCRKLNVIFWNYTDDRISRIAAVSSAP